MPGCGKSVLQQLLKVSAHTHISLFMVFMFCVCVGVCVLTGSGYFQKHAEFCFDMSVSECVCEKEVVIFRNTHTVLL